MMGQYRVSATALNLRTSPEMMDDNRLATLPQHTILERLADAPNGWWKVRATLQGAPVQGFVNAKYLVDVHQPDTAVEHRGVTAVHLTENQPEITRNGTNGRAFPIGEPSRPPTLSGGDDGRKARLLAIIDWLDVENGARWHPMSGSTFCNIYAYDVCYLAGVYLPRVWWITAAILDLTAGKPAKVRYGLTVHELNANALADWFEDYGNRFGWERTFDLTALQDAANSGQPSVIVAQRSDVNRSGLIQIIAPEHPDFSAQRRNGVVWLPLQSQAGTHNFCYGFLGNQPWWANTKMFRKHGFWINRA